MCLQQAASSRLPAAGAVGHLRRACNHDGAMAAQLAARHTTCVSHNAGCSSAGCGACQLPCLQALVAGAHAAICAALLPACCSSVPSGRVGNSKDAIFRSNEHFREAVADREAQVGSAAACRLSRRRMCLVGRCSEL